MRAATATEKSANGTEGATRATRPASVESLVSEVRERARDEWPPRIYREPVLSMRTRSHAVPAPLKNAKGGVEILHTLLGIELRVGRRGISCPDIATAAHPQLDAEQ